MAQRNPSLYPYPAVQYIPLLTAAIAEGPWSPPSGHSRPALHVGKNDPDWREFLRRTYGLALPPLTLASGEILLLGLNLRLLDLKYRGHFVTALAEEAPYFHQLLRLKQNVFYKDRIIFTAFTREGRKLCWQSWQREPVKAARQRV